MKLIQIKTIVFESPVFRQTIAALVCGLIAIQAGLNNGFSAILLPQLEAESPSTDNVEIGSWIASLTPIGMIVGGVSVGFILDEFGRKYGQIVITLSVFFCWILTGFANNLVLIIIGRFLTAAICGAIRPATVVYIGEISNPKYRGLFLTLPTFCLNIGLLVIHGTGTFISWNICAFMSSVIAFFCFVFVLYLKESPLWMITRGQKEAGEKQFKWLRGDTEEAGKELKEVFEKIKDRSKKLSFKEKTNIICSKRFLKPFCLTAAFFVVVHFSGIITLQYYAHDILKKSFKDTVSTFSLVMITDIIRLLSTLFVVVIDKFLPRKFTFICFCYLTGVLLLCLSLFFYLETTGLVWLSVLLIVLYVSFGASVVVMSWTLIGEIFPGDIRGIASGFSATLSYVFIFIAVKITPGIMRDYGEAALYALFGIITLIGTVFVNLMLPRTNGRTLQDIENSYNETKSERHDKNQNDFEVKCTQM